MRRCKVQHPSPVITTEVMVAELPQRNRDNPAMPAGGGMDF